MTATSPPEKLVGALGSGLKILGYLASSATPIGVTRIAKDLKLNPSTCFNLLKTLVHERLVTFDESAKTYGMGLVELAKESLEKASYVRMMRPHLQELADRHNITPHLVATLARRSSGAGGSGRKRFRAARSHEDRSAPAHAHCGARSLHGGAFRFDRRGNTAQGQRTSMGRGPQFRDIHQRGRRSQPEGPCGRSRQLRPRRHHRLFAHPGFSEPTGEGGERRGLQQPVFAEVIASTVRRASRTLPRSGHCRLWRCSPEAVGVRLSCLWSIHCHHGSRYVISTD